MDEGVPGEDRNSRKGNSMTILIQLKKGRSWYLPFFVQENVAPSLTVNQGRGGFSLPLGRLKSPLPIPRAFWKGGL